MSLRFRPSKDSTKEMHHGQDGSLFADWGEVTRMKSYRIGFHLQGLIMIANLSNMLEPQEISMIAVNNFILIITIRQYKCFKRMAKLQWFSLQKFFGGNGMSQKKHAAWRRPALAIKATWHESFLDIVASDILNFRHVLKRRTAKNLKYNHKHCHISMEYVPVDHFLSSNYVFRE